MSDSHGIVGAEAERQSAHPLQPEPSAFGSEAEPAETVDQPDQVVITGAFLTGCPIHVNTERYQGLQHELSNLLTTAHSWEALNTFSGPGTYHSGGGFERALPMVLLRRGGAATMTRLMELVRAEGSTEEQSLGTQLASWHVTFRDVRIDIYDLGMAVLTVGMDLQVPAAIGNAEAARQMKHAVWLRADEQTGRVTPIVRAIQILCEETITQLNHAVETVGASVRQQPWLSPTGGSRTNTPDTGRLLWLHPVHLARTKGPARHREIADSLSPAFHRQIELAGGRFVPGIGWSAVVLTQASDSDKIALRLIEMQWAYIALYMEIDRGLLQALEDDRWHRDDPLRNLEDDADRVFGSFIRVMEARSRVDTALAGLGGDEQVIWDAMNEVTRLDALIAGVDRKVAVLQRIAERRVQQATAASSRRTTAILSFLTALTVVTVSIALMGNFLGNPSDAVGHFLIRLTIVSAALAVAIVLYREAFRDRPLHRRRRRTR